jgi:hypothetical protein
MKSNRLNQIVTAIETAPRVTLGQVDNALLSTMVQCGDSLAITRYGRVEAYVLPVDHAQDLANSMAVLECEILHAIELDGLGGQALIERIKGLFREEVTA